MINTVIVDDSDAAVVCLADKLEKYADVQVVATATCGEDGLREVARRKPELLFLDVELPDMTGIEFLERMNGAADGACHVVMYTAYADYMLPAFRNKAFDFLLKP